MFDTTYFDGYRYFYAMCPKNEVFEEGMVYPIGFETLLVGVFEDEPIMEGECELFDTLLNQVLPDYGIKFI